MRRENIQKTLAVCEACEIGNLNQTVMGMEINESDQQPIYLCEKCGPIDLELMQFCRELVTRCDNN